MFYSLFFSLSWVIIPAVLIYLLPKVWLYFVRTRFVRSIKWVLLEIRVPKEILKTPKAMEQIFSAIYAMYSYGFTRLQKWIEGQVELWTSCEIVGHAGGTHFYIRIPLGQRNLLEAAIYSQYPDAEIREVEDYVNELPPALPNQNYDVFGFEFILVKPDPYPIKTYAYFESITEAQIEEKRIDPIAAITEISANLKEDERVWIQILCRPAPGEWKEKGQKLINELVGKKEPKKLSWLEETAIFFWNFFKAPVEYPTWPEPAEEKPVTPFSFHPPGIRAQVEAIENKTSKLGFD